MDAVSTLPPRACVDGRFFRLGAQKLYLKGVSYGPFAPGARQESFASPEQTARDFRQIRELGANLFRVYHIPPRWLLDLAAEHQLKLLIDIPWSKNRCFLDSEELRQEAREAVREAALACAGHPSVFAYSMVNEIPAEIVRWSGARPVAEFIDELVGVAKSADPGCLCTFGNYPPTEFLRPRAIDFVSFNVYLHQQRSLANYLARLQMQSDPKPLVLSEFGIDSKREGETRKCEILGWTIETAFCQGLAGAVVFSFTDDWFMGGRQVEDWSMGLTTIQRQPKDSFFAVQKKFEAAPFFPLKATPKVSVVVACYNGAPTLKACLDSLVILKYPDYEVILVDDGSTDGTPQITSLYPRVRYVRQPHRGLSIARNTGISSATGEVIAFTDADCRADEGWLYYLMGELVENQVAGVGGPNYLPSEDSAVAAAVLASPGGPAHVMLTDRIAEHIPGCNMAFYKWALDEAGGFDGVFHEAGDDVDICWRLQQRGYQLGFSPAAFVWHHRRSTISAYLKQQKGYGEAEALLVRKHPEYFNLLGGSMWRGHIYTASKFGLIVQRAMVYHGLFGTGFFQTLYAAEPASTLMFFTSLEYHVLATMPLLVLAGIFPFLLPLAVASLGMSLGICAVAGLQADLPQNRRQWWLRPLVALLFFLQPIVRGWARYQGRLSFGTSPTALGEPGRHPAEPTDQLCYWSKGGIDRLDFLNSILAQLEHQGWPLKVDTGWCKYDIEVYGSRWSRLQLTTVTEQLAGPAKLFRCRLRSTWSLLAKVSFFGAFALDLLLVGMAGDWFGVSIWGLVGLPLLALFAWFLKRENRALKNVVANLVQEKANHSGMTRLEHDGAEEKFVPVKDI